MLDKLDCELDLHRLWCERFREAVGDLADAVCTKSGDLLVAWERDGEAFAAAFGLAGIRAIRFDKSGRWEQTRVGGDWLAQLVRFYESGRIDA